MPASDVLAAERRVAVRMRAVQQPDERAIGDRARHVAQLRQPVQPQLAHALEVGLGERRPRDDVGEQRAAPGSVKRLSAVIVSSAASEPMSESSCAPSRASASCISIAERPPLPSSSMSSVSAARPSLPGGSSAAPRRDEQRSA